ncbi:ASCH domain-containing protein [Salipiger manganoxidans]|uniref:ASCH domain-containing protein n=1 Tax=Salipiger marinus TaxID=555512 RepID=UPI001E5B164C|nr:ASCH domain-containing protein [Salipiger manganoxidans]MCD1620106.1 ASCH domain-containing protein [Salipiger manganoxidans]
MKALSIRQPWADAIIWHGKDVENRRWPTRYRGPVLIHAAKAWGKAERADLAFVEDMTATKLEDTDRPLLGGIIGRAEIVDCVEAMDSRWFFGPYGFVLRNAEALPFQPCRGALGFFTPSIITPAQADQSS